MAAVSSTPSGWARTATDPIEVVTPLDDLSDRLRRHSDPAKKTWWENYLKGVIEFYGVPMAAIRKVVHGWAEDHRFDSDLLRGLAIDSLRSPIAEEKLAGILMMQELLLPTSELESARDLPLIAAVFDDGDIYDWNTTDWLCVRVLGPMIEADGQPTASILAGWTDAPTLWRRRSAAVAFVPVATRGDQLFEGLVDIVLTVCASNITDSERFAQTGVGWVLRELSDAEPERVYQFVLANRGMMSREAVRMAASRMGDQERSSLGIVGKRLRR
jgi:3-methyladenine DNA glycosylase AlkD